MSEAATQALLVERGKTHGDWVLFCDLAQYLKLGTLTEEVIHKLAPDQVEAIQMIFHKIARAVTGDPDHVDHWDDIAGYAKLVSNRLQGIV